MNISKNWKRNLKEWLNLRYKKKKLAKDFDSKNDEDLNDADIFLL